jgi:acetate kinase
MGSKILIINIGSASKKYSVYDGMDEVIFFHFEKSGEGFILSVKTEGKFEKDDISKEDYDNSLEFLSNYLLDNLNIEISDFSLLSFRIVAPGDYFLHHKEIDDGYLQQLENAKKNSELHLTPVLEELEKSQKIFSEQKKIGISDSAFHNTKLEVSKYYGISKDLQDKYNYKRFGYHGISVESVIDKIKSKQKTLPEKILVCHLGGGISITAVKNGKSLDNTMGFSPLEGPIMATRSGNVDFTLLQDLFKKQNINDSKLQDEFLFKKSGILGLSNISNDLRVLKEETFKGNKDARFAVQTYVYNILKYIYQMVSVLKGVDLLVFTGTIGHRADFIRELILDEMAWDGYKYDLDKNISVDSSSDYFYISASDSDKEILVCETDEMKTMAKISLKMM